MVVGRNTVRQRCQLQDWTEQSRLSPARQTLVAQLADGQSYNGHGKAPVYFLSAPGSPFQDIHNGTGEEEEARHL